ncbi:hypothetical protein EFK50_04400 [Nocardioides marmoriginsengisoli]|uniref:GatB/YqeY domain-containing protein n=1 Tax=Nocardioides marmoriginsengisoli TaxID=661483 RepID=A0A3N0CPI9_9ACTN|nr:GatB/YqeY domain-containing protein [Nocardioides marmoriginsengisoli]RNL65211.1 hypothetical protein EFK50_04400 [Nocardioides marmoriginsengisoli]
MSELHDTLRTDLTTAMRARDTDRVRVLRTVLAAIANAEAQPAADAGPVSARTSGPIAGAVSGLGATETDRRDLSEDEVRAIVRAEHDERIDAAGALPAQAAAQADVLRAEAALLAEYLS